MSNFAFRIALPVLLITILMFLMVIGTAHNPMAAKVWKDGWNELSGRLAIGIAMSLYFLPAIIAGFRGHHNTAAVLVLNFFLGWTVLGWIASLVWSATAVAPRQGA